jgi:hypothetical protein
MKRVGAREQALPGTHRGRTAAVGVQERRHLCFRERPREVVTLPELAAELRRASPPRARWVDLLVPPSTRLPPLAAAKTTPLGDVPKTTNPYPALAVRLNDVRREQRWARARLSPSNTIPRTARTLRCSMRRLRRCPAPSGQNLVAGRIQPWAAKKPARLLCPGDSFFVLLGLLSLATIAV